MASAIEDLLETMRRLRGPGGCPWDHEQTHQSLREPLMEEVAELLDTIDREDFAHMREELGDVLLQVVFHSQIAAEAGRFDFDAVAREINDKLIRRHPHVFGSGQLSDSAAVLSQWEDIKAQEKKNGPEPVGRFKRLPPALPALLQAWNVAKQLQKFQIPLDQVLADANGTVADSKVDGTMTQATEGNDPPLHSGQAGEQLFRIVYAMRIAGIEPESALRQFVHGLVDKLNSDR